MASPMNQPQTFQLKVATAKIKKQVKDGPLFFILPTLLVAGVIVFCYVVPAPDWDKASQGEATVAAAPAPEEQEIIGVVYDESAVPMEESAFMAEEEPPMADAEYQDFEEVADDEGEDPADTDEESPSDDAPDDSPGEAAEDSLPTP